MTAKCNHVIKQTRIVHGHGPMQAIPQEHTQARAHTRTHMHTHILLNTQVGLKNAHNWMCQ